MRMRCRLIAERDGGRARFECPHGHRFERAIIDRRKGQGRFMAKGTSAATRLLARYWRDGVSMDCPKCLDEDLPKEE